LRDVWKNGKNYSEAILYPVAGAFAEHLINYNKEKFLELCTKQTYENAQIIYDLDLVKILNNFNN